MAGKENQLKLVIRAVDEATAPVRHILAGVSAALGVVHSKVSGPLKKFGDSVKNVGAQALGLAKNLGTMAAVGAVAFGAFIHSAMQAGDDLATLSQRVGLSANEFASLQFAMAQSDVSAEQFSNAMDKLARGMGEAKAGTGKALGFFQKVSPVLAEQFKHAKTTEEGLALMTSAFERVKDPARRAALATKIFGDAQMGQALGQGSAKIQELRTEFMRLNGDSEKFAAGAGELDNALIKTSTALEGVRNAIAAEFFPVFTALAKEVTEFVAKNREGIRLWAEGAAKAIGAWVNGGGMQRLTDSLGKVASAIGAVLTFLGPWGTAMAGVTVMALPLITAIGSMAIAGVQLAVALAPHASILTGIASTLGATALAAAPFIAAAAGIALAGKAIYDNWGDLKLLFKDLGWWIRDTMDAAWSKVKAVIDLIGRIPGMGRIAEGLKGIGDIAVNYQTAQVGALTGAVANAGPLMTMAPSLGAGPVLQSIGPNRSEARVSVDFSNLPKGARVSTDPKSSADVSTDVGYSMAPGT